MRKGRKSPKTPRTLMCFCCLHMLLNERSKKLVVKLRRIGLSGAMLSRFSGLSRGQIAAYLAWDTMRKQRNLRKNV